VEEEEEEAAAEAAAAATEAMSPERRASLQFKRAKEKRSSLVQQGRSAMKRRLEAKRAEASHLQSVYDRFRLLDIDKSNSLTIDEMTHGQHAAMEGTGLFGSNALSPGACRAILNAFDDSGDGALQLDEVKKIVQLWGNDQDTAGLTPTTWLAGFSKHITRVLCMFESLDPSGSGVVKLSALTTVLPACVDSADIQSAFKIAAPSGGGMTLRGFALLLRPGDHPTSRKVEVVIAFLASAIEVDALERELKTRERDLATAMDGNKRWQARAEHLEGELHVSDERIGAKEQSEKIGRAHV
jgi:hypothetical protein